MLRACVLLAAFSFATIAWGDEPPKTPKAIEDAVKGLEKALAASKDETERQQLKAAIEALKSVTAAAPTKPQNQLISDFIDNTAKYKGRTVAFQVRFISFGETLRTRVGQKGVPFKANDPANNAELLLGVEIPKDLTVPDAKRDEEVVIVFKCKDGSATAGNEVISISRPAKK